MSERAGTKAAYDGSEVAVVGMAGRFPGAPDLAAFWRNLADGVESISVFSPEELEQAGEDPKKVKDPNYVPARPILSDVELFDAAFFGFSPREAEILDPQLRLFLECAWTALEHAGHDTDRLEGQVSLFAGASFSNYLVHNLYKNRAVMRAFGDQQTTIFNVQDSLVTMVGYKLNLKGVCCAVQTFCSTSLVAVHMACQNLLNYESDLALAGGVTVYVPQKSGYVYEEGSILSRRGHCRVFDAGADGTVFGNGLGIVVLRRLADAEKDGDTVHAVIRGSAVNNDGSLKVSFAAPGVVGQTGVMVEALAAADINPETIGYVEAHGTGTRLGDPAEVSALTKAFRTRTGGKGFCALGSVKSNVGHLDAAAGVAGLIKVVLSLEHGQIPPSLNFEAPNPAIDFANSPFYVNTALREWARKDGPRRAGVSAFGVGGTNAHLVVEEAPARRPLPPSRGPQLLVLSAKTGEALAAAGKELADYLEAHSDLDLADVAYTLQIGRRAFAERRFVLAASGAEAVVSLRSGEGLAAACHRRSPPVVACLKGEEWAGVNAWRELYDQVPAFRNALQECVAAAGGHGQALLSALYPDRGREEAAGRALQEPYLGAAATFAVEFALSRLFAAWGVRFEAWVGEGVGAPAALCLRGESALETSLRRATDGGRTAGRSGSEASPPGGDPDPVTAAGSLPPDRDRLHLELGPGWAALSGETGIEVGRSREASTPGYAQVLQILGGLWLAGVDVDWAALHAASPRRRVPLPTYCFQRERHWVEPSKDEEPRDVPRDPAEWLYRPVWQTGFPAPRRARSGPERTLVFLDSLGVGREVAARLRSEGGDVIAVEAGSTFAGHPTSGYTLDPAQAGHYSLLWRALAREQRLPERVLHFWALESVPQAPSDGARFQRASDLGFYSLLSLAATRPPGPLGLTVIATGLHEVMGSEPLAPEKAPLIPLCRILAQEQHDLKVDLIDVEAGPEAATDLAEAIVAELSLDRPEALVALRGGRRWAQGFERISSTVQERLSPQVRPGGVYLVTGGLGDVGFALAVWLARQAKAKLVLIGRSGLLPRDRWASWLETHDALEGTTLRIRKVEALEALGAEVLVVAADASRVGEMEGAVRAARDRFGALHGVIHAAGDLGRDTFRPVVDLGREACERQFAPKVYGLMALDEALQGEDVDFCMLTSSLSSVLGGVGYAAYAGANAFMDAYAARAAQRKGRPWVSVNWDQWNFGGGVPSGRGGEAAAAGLSLTPEEGLAVFERILRLPYLDRIVVSTGSLSARLERWVENAAPTAAASGGRRPRPVLSVPYLAPASETERTLANIWEELLGIDKIGVQDNFFELGGHSLFAARLLSRVRSALGVSVSLETVFEAPTIAELATRVAGGGTTGAEVGVERVEIEI